MERTGKVQIISCSNCDAVFAACVEPECYSDAEWQKQLRKYVNRGEKVNLVDSGSWKFTRCECNKKTKKKSNPNQLKLFK
jgi:hypothetical protein